MAASEKNNYNSLIRQYPQCDLVANKFASSSWHVHSPLRGSKGPTEDKLVLELNREELHDLFSNLERVQDQLDALSS
eukprot:1195574-Prorocentrum_minimum.AAC.1